MSNFKIVCLLIVWTVIAWTPAILLTAYGKASEGIGVATFFVWIITGVGVASIAEVGPFK